jgi:capsular polysaccharide biosynthesis protein
MAAFTSEGLTYLRNTLLPYKSTIQTPEYVFIARRKATKRRGYNEQECGETLKKLGFEEVYPETLTLAEQIAVFNNAKIIVGATGAAFTNLIFCSNKTNVVILSNYKVGFPYFSSIASFVGSRLIYLYDKKLGEVPNYKTSYAHEAFHVDVKDLKELVSKIITE